MIAPVELETFLAHLDRPGATPAPTAAGPGDPPPGTPSGPWHPRHGEKACGCGVLDGEDCDCAEFAAQARTAARRPIFFDFRKDAA